MSDSRVDANISTCAQKMTNVQLR